MGTTALSKPHGALILMDESRQCTAKSKQSGVRCKRAAIFGGRVCKMHGGGHPKVIENARKRIQEMVAPALAAISEIIDDKENPSRLGAARDILDRAGYKPSDKLEIEGTLSLTEIARQRLAKLNAKPEEPRATS